MKKAFLKVCATVVVFIIGLFAIIKIAESVIKDNEKYIQGLLSKNIKSGMTPDQLNLYFKKFDRQLGLWECSENGMRRNDCIGERVLVVTLPLPSDFFWLGKGDAQIYFYIDSNNIMENFDYELYYPIFH